MAGCSVARCFAGVLMIAIFSVNLGRFPSIYVITLRMTDWESFVRMLHQLALPVAVRASFNAAELSRCARMAVLENLSQDHVRTARARALGAPGAVLVDVLRNAMIPAVTIIALGLPTIFGGAIITEPNFKVNGIGAALIGAIHASDLPVVQTLTFILAVLSVLLNLIADIPCAGLDPRIRGR